VRRLLPDCTDSVDLVDAYAPPKREQVFVRLNMISSIDGAISVDGRSGALGGEPDRRVFATLRAWADVVLVGAGTVRAENYGPVRFDEEVRQARVARGQRPVPPIAVVSRAATFDDTTPFFTEAVVPPIVVTTEANAKRVEREAAGRAEAIGAGTDEVDLARAIAQLSARGFHSVLAEGGPRLNGDLARAGLLDELCLTLSPRIVGGDGPRILAVPPLDPPYEPGFVHLLEDEAFLFFRLSLRT
jgi:riboflavin biosynthesis pyrimidine reductase